MNVVLYYYPWISKSSWLIDQVPLLWDGSTSSLSRYFPFLYQMVIPDLLQDIVIFHYVVFKRHLSVIVSYYSYLLPSVKIYELVGARFSAPVQTGPGDHPASCTMGTGSFLGVNCGRSETLTPNPFLVPWSRKSRAVPLLPLWAVWPVQSLSACTRVHFTLLYPVIVLYELICCCCCYGCHQYYLCFWVCVHCHFGTTRVVKKWKLLDVGQMTIVSFLVLIETSFHHGVFSGSRIFPFCYSVRNRDFSLR